MSKILVNKWETPDGTILESKHRHDYVEYVDTVSGENYAVDGGLAYLRCSMNKVPMKSHCIYSDDDIEKIRGHFKWGSYGKLGNQPLHYILLKDMTDDHIHAILETQFHIPEYIKEVFRDELTYRLFSDITIKECDNGY